MARCCRCCGSSGTCCSGRGGRGGRGGSGGRGGWVPPAGTACLPRLQAAPTAAGAGGSRPMHAGVATPALGASAGGSRTTKPDCCCCCCCCPAEGAAISSCSCILAMPAASLSSWISWSTAAACGCCCWCCCWPAGMCWACHRRATCLRHATAATCDRELGWGGSCRFNEIGGGI